MLLYYNLGRDQEVFPLRRRLNPSLGHPMSSGPWRPGCDAGRAFAGRRFFLLCPRTPPPPPCCTFR